VHAESGSQTFIHRFNYAPANSRTLIPAVVRLPRRRTRPGLANRSGRPTPGRPGKGSLTERTGPAASSGVLDAEGIAGSSGWRASAAREGAASIIVHRVRSGITQIGALVGRGPVAHSAFWAPGEPTGPARGTLG